jgi:hypothetical protein
MSRNCARSLFAASISRWQRRGEIGPAQVKSGIP